jgi:hypothetical protein
MSILSGNPAKKNIFNPIKNSGGAQRPQWKILNTNFLFQTKNLGKETDVPANSERVRLQNSLSTLHQIKGESEILCALYFYLSSTPTQLFWIQNRYALQEFSFASLQLHVVESS